MEYLDQIFSIKLETESKLMEPCQTSQILYLVPLKGRFNVFNGVFNTSDVLVHRSFQGKFLPAIILVLFEWNSQQQCKSQRVYTV